MSDIRTDVPITLNPASLGNLQATLAQENTLGSDVFAAATAALQTAHTAYAALNDVEKALIKTNPVRQQIGGRTQLVANPDDYADAASAAWARTAPALDKQMDRMRKIETGLAAKVAEAIELPSRKTPEGLSIASEVRAFVKSLPEGERMNFARNAILADDKTTVTALIHAPAYLSGLSNGAYDLIREQASQRFGGKDYEQLNATRAAMQHVANAGSVLLDRFGPVMQRKDSPQKVARNLIKALAG